MPVISPTIADIPKYIASTPYKIHIYTKIDRSLFLTDAIKPVIREMIANANTPNVISAKGIIPKNPALLFSAFIPIISEIMLIRITKAMDIAMHITEYQPFLVFGRIVNFIISSPLIYFKTKTKLLYLQ